MSTKWVLALHCTPHVVLVFSNHQWIAEPALHAMQQSTSFQPADQVLIADPAWHGALEVLVISKRISIASHASHALHALQHWTVQWHENQQLYDCSKAVIGSGHMSSDLQ